MIGFDEDYEPKLTPYEEEQLRIQGRKLNNHDRTEAIGLFYYDFDSGH